MISAGKMNKRVSIENSVVGSPAVNDFGEPISTWQKFAEVWAAIEPLTGREYWAQQQVQSEITVRIRIRYRKWCNVRNENRRITYTEDGEPVVVEGYTDDYITPGMRVNYNNAYYIIKNIIDPLEKHEELQLMCSEGVRES